MSSPTIEFDGATYTVSLFRSDEAGSLKKVYLTFGEHTLTVCACREDEISPSERLLIKGPVADDGFLYYLHAKPYDSAMRSSIVWLKNKEEAVAIERVLLFLEENEGAEPAYEEDDQCSFCGGEKDSADECYIDHDEELREEFRKEFSVEVHSP
jgi:hypothetical protein